MRVSPGTMSIDIMRAFPSGKQAVSFGSWVAQNAGLEEFIGLAGWLGTEFCEIEGHLLWNRYELVGADTFQFLRESVGRPQEGDETVERYVNLINLREFLLESADAAVGVDELVYAFGKVLAHFWGSELKRRFPTRAFEFSIEEDVYSEHGPCLMFWERRETSKHGNAGSLGKLQSASGGPKYGARSPVTFHDGLFPHEILMRFPSRRGTPTFGDWVPNHVGLEQILGIAGWLDPDLYEIEGRIFWNGEAIGDASSLRELKRGVQGVGDDPREIERYFNRVNLRKFFVRSDDPAFGVAEMFEAFGQTLVHFWGMALENRFPGREFRFEVADLLFQEPGPWVTFSQPAQGDVVQG